MSSHDLVIVILIAGAFMAFGTTLGATIWYAGKDKDLNS